MSDVFRWGILGTGNIADKFAIGLQALPDAKLIAVGSRAQSTADTFSDRFDVPHRHASYEALANDPEIDAIYVSSPHPLHKANSILCLEAGKPVLCEKPFTINQSEARELVSVARTQGVFLMEAMWTRFLPVFDQVRTWIARGAIGEVRMVHADFGFRAGLDPTHRLFNPALGGGGLMDIGVYTVSFASLVFGRQPSTITSHAHLGETGVDEQAAMIFGYEEGQIAVLSCAVRTTTPQDGKIMGTEGMIMLESPFWHSQAVTLTAGKRRETLNRPYEGNGYNCEAAEVQRCVRAGKTESDTMPLDETLAIMETLDAIRAQWGLRYPME